MHFCVLVCKCLSWRLSGGRKAGAKNGPPCVAISDVSSLFLSSFCPPFVSHTNNQVGSFFAILVVIAVLYPVANVISALVKEKELRIKEGLKMMGLTDAAHTASWAFHFLCLFFFTSLLMVLVSGSLFEFRCVRGGDAFSL